MDLTVQVAHVLVAERLIEASERRECTLRPRRRRTSRRVRTRRA